MTRVTIPTWIDAAARIAVSADHPLFSVRSQCQSAADLLDEVQGLSAVLNHRDRTHHWTVTAEAALGQGGQLFLRCERTVSRSKTLAHQYAQGISMRMVKGFDWYTDQNPTRLDVLYGVGVINSTLAVRITANAEDA